MSSVVAQRNNGTQAEEKHETNNEHISACKTPIEVSSKKQHLPPLKTGTRNGQPNKKIKYGKRVLTNMKERAKAVM